MKLVAGWNGGKSGPTCPDVEGPCCGPVFYTPMGLGTETDAIVVSTVSQERADWKAEQIALRVNNHERLVEALRECRDSAEAAHKCRYSGGDLNQALARQEIAERKADELLASLEAEKGGEL